MNKNTRKKILKEIKILFILIILIILVRSTFVEPFRIPTESMKPTLISGDFILVNKMSYGLKVPFTDFLENPIYLFYRKGPKRGDVVVFTYPKDPSIYYVKRIIGLPGDTIEIKKKIVYLNGKPIVMEKDKSSDGSFNRFKCLMGENNFFIQYQKENFFNVNYKKREVPQGHFFVMGDNRDFSYDSRFWGFVPFKNIKGKAFVIWFSMTLPGRRKELTLRSERIGTSI